MELAAWTPSFGAALQCQTRWQGWAHDDVLSHVSALMRVQVTGIDPMTVAALIGGEGRWSCSLSSKQPALVMP